MDKKGAPQKASMVRIGAFDYEPDKLVKMHTLDALVEDQQKKDDQFVDHEKIDINCKKLDEIDNKIHKLEKQAKDASEAGKKKAKQLVSEMRLKTGELLTETNALRQMKKTASRKSNFIESEILHKSKII